MKTIVRTSLIVLVAALAHAGLASWCLVAPGEVVVVRRLGRALEPPWGPGLHWRIPWGIDRVDRVRADAVRQLWIGPASPEAAGMEPAVSEILTGDLNLLRTLATVQYRVARPLDYVKSAQPVESLLGSSAASSITRALAVRGVDAVLRADRQAIARDVERALQADADRYRLGVMILGVSLTDLRPPSEVEADFAAAQSAGSERERRITEARSYEETTVATARSRAQAALEAAHAAASRRILIARASADRFNALCTELERSRALAIRRLYVESVQALLARVKTKIVLPPGEAVDLTVLGIKE